MNGSLDAAAVALWAPIIAGFAMVVVAWLNQRVPRVAAAQTAEAAFRGQVLEDHARVVRELNECQAKRFAVEEELLHIKGASERCHHEDCPVRELK